MKDWLKRMELMGALFGAQKFSVFLLDDNRLYLKGLQKHLENKLGEQVKIKSFLTSDDLIAAMKDGPNVVVVDYHLDEKSSVEGLSLVSNLSRLYPETEIIVLTSEENVDVALRCYDEGASNFIKKNLNAIEHVVKELLYKIDLAKSA